MFKILFGGFLMIPLFLIICLAIFWSVQFSTSIGGHMELAAHANSIEMAQSEMQKVVDTMELKGLTKGTTKIIFNYPEYSIDFWYNNMKSSLEQLKSLKPNTSELEKSNTLIKLRETLIKHGEKSDYVNVPEGISIFPYNVLFCIVGWIAGILAILGLIIMLVGFSDL
jgi:hypothetical protein